jgi:hypothetical protein
MTKKTQQNSFNIFKWLENLTFNKKPWSSFTPDQHDLFEPWLIHRYISMNKEYIDLVNIVQKFPLTEKEKIHNTYLTLLPKKKMFLRYIKKQSQPINKEVAEYVAKYYECSIGEAEEYISLLREPGVRDILWKLGLEEKEVNKLIKKVNI